MELLYARGRASSTKQPGLLKHRDKRLLIAVIASTIAGAGLGEIFWPRGDATRVRPTAFPTRPGRADAAARLRAHCPVAAEVLAMDEAPA